MRHAHESAAEAAESDLLETAPISKFSARRRDAAAVKTSTPFGPPIMSVDAAPPGAKEASDVRAFARCAPRADSSSR